MPATRRARRRSRPRLVAAALAVALTCAVGSPVHGEPAGAKPPGAEPTGAEPADTRAKPRVLEDGTVVLPAPEPTQASFAGVSMIAGTPLLLVGVVYVGTAWQRDRALKTELGRRDANGDITGIAFQTAGTEANAIRKRWRRGWWLTGIGGALLTTGIILRATTDEPPVFGALAPTRRGWTAALGGRF